VDSVRRLHEEFQAVCLVLKEQEETSLEVSMRAQWSKAIVLASASFFERELCSCILETVPAAFPLLKEFVQRQALSRRYHTLFSWDAKNANSFFGLFGPDFADRAKSAVSEDPELQSAVRAFLGLGQQRNAMVHGDFASFSLDATAEEVFSKFEAAQRFVSWVAGRLRETQPSAAAVEVDSGTH